MCKRGGMLIGWDFDSRRALVTRGDCDSWSCPECARRMAESWVLRAQIGVRQFLSIGLTVDFVTITSHEKLHTFAQTENVWREAWPVLYAALKRKNQALQYFIVPEKHKDGRMHVHALWTAGVSQKWLKDNARRRGLGYQAKIKRVSDVHAAARYVTKYIGKSLGDDVPPKFRRVRVSQAWPVIPAPVTENMGLKWEYTRDEAVLEAIFIDARDKGIALVDMTTGAYLDASGWLALVTGKE